MTALISLARHLVLHSPMDAHGIGGGTTPIQYPLNSTCTDFWACAVPYLNSNILNSEHPGGVQFALGDGSVRFVSETIDLTQLKLLAIRNDDQVVTLP